MLGPTDPNRLHMWTGMIDPKGTGGGPVIDNSPAYNNAILSWTTYPERLQRAGVSWQVYQEEDNYDDNADLWRKTLFILTYDENDGLFDHVPPPVAPRGTLGEYVGGEPIGLGFRVPAIVVSPWSAGGRVCSDVLDHTSLIRIIERRFGVREPNISAFRRRTCGDFTSALRFSGAPAGYPRSPAPLTLAAAEAGLLTAQQEVFANPRAHDPRDQRAGPAPVRIFGAERAGACPGDPSAWLQGDVGQRRRG